MGHTDVMMLLRTTGPSAQTPFMRQGPPTHPFRAKGAKRIAYYDSRQATSPKSMLRLGQGMACEKKMGGCPIKRSKHSDYYAAVAMGTGSSYHKGARRQ